MPENEIPNYDESQGGFGEKMGSVLEPIKKFGVGKLVLLLIIFGALAWFFVLAPKPAKLTVLVTEIDSGETIPGAVVTISIPGQKDLSQFTEEDGVAIFKDVPSRTPLDIAIEPPESHEVQRKGDVELESGKDKSIPFEVGKSNRLTLTLAQKELQLGAGCTTSVPLEIKNEGSTPETVQLIGTDSLAGLISAETKTVASSTIETVQVRISAPKKAGEGSVSGSVRARLTNSQDELSLKVGEPTEADISPDRISERVVPGQTLKTLITTTNRGREGEIRDLSVQATGDIPTFTKAEFTDTTPLKPDEKKILTVVMDIPSATGKLVGTLLISTSCRVYPIPVELEIEEPSE